MNSSWVLDYVRVSTLIIMAIAYPYSFSHNLDEQLIEFFIVLDTIASNANIYREHNREGNIR